jgi:Spy/CpxP family protein refolding chaperone
MKYKTRLATLLLSTALIAAPCFASAAYAHEQGGWDKSGSAECAHKHLSEAQIKLLHETMHKAHEANKGTIEEMHKLREERRNILAAKTFDKAAFLSITAQIEKKHEQLKKSRIQAFASIADKFTPEERERLAHMLAHRHHGMRHAGWHHGEGHEGWHHHHHDGQEGWRHHEGQEDGANNQNQTPPKSNREDYPPYSTK